MRTLLLLVLVSSRVFANAAAGGVDWLPWSDDIFKRATAEKKLVILDLEAVWCHWCHVMEEKTYSDPKVQKILKEKYLAVKVDQDSRPDLSNRYEDYGWPATILFSPAGVELAKRSGYIAPDEMQSMLQAFVDDPTPGPSAEKSKPVAVSDATTLPKKMVEKLKKDFHNEYDTKAGAWGFGHKFLQADSLAYALKAAAAGDKEAEKRAKETLAKIRQLIDPAWGGAYQYSTGGVWTEPHFEKIMSVQADYLRLASLAYGLWHDEGDKKTAAAVHKFLTTILMSPEGAFYTSQDADVEQGKHSAEYFALDDKARRAKGIPQIDKHVYSRENGWAADAMITYAVETGDKDAMETATKAIQWIVAHRANGQGFKHDEDDGGRMFLGDSLAMGQAMLRLYAATGDRQWMKRASDAAAFIADKFPFKDAKGKAGGYVTFVAKSPFPAMPTRDENVGVARFANMLFQYTGDEAHKKIAETAMKFLTTPEIASRHPASSLLLVDSELAKSPLHLTVVGKKKDDAAGMLFNEAASYPLEYKRVEWLDESEGPLPRTDVKYPTLAKAAAFICTDQRCSLPIFKAEDLRPQVARVLAPPK